MGPAAADAGGRGRLVVTETTDQDGTNNKAQEC